MFSHLYLSLYNPFIFFLRVGIFLVETVCVFGGGVATRRRCRCVDDGLGERRRLLLCRYIAAPLIFIARARRVRPAAARVYIQLFFLSTHYLPLSLSLSLSVSYHSDYLYLTAALHVVRGAPFLASALSVTALARVRERRQRAQEEKGAACALPRRALRRDLDLGQEGGTGQGHLHVWCIYHAMV